MSPSWTDSTRPRWPIWLGMALLISLAGAVLWLAAGGQREEAGAPGLPRPAPGARPQATRPATELAAAAAPAADPEAERQLLSSAEALRTPNPIEPAPTEGIPLRVVTGDPATPVPGVVIAFLDERSMIDEDLREVRAGNLTFDQILERLGRRFRADAEGLVTIPAPRGFGLVAGGTRELWGLLKFTEHELELVLEITPDPPLVVRVVDGAGRPVGGVPVALRQRFDGSVRDVSWGESARRTGLTTLRHVERFLAENENDGTPLVALAILAAEASEHALDPARLPTETIELVLPPTGAVELTLEDGAGKPFRDTVFVRLIQTPKSGSKARALGRAERIQRVAEGGRLVIQHIGLGLDLTLELRAEGHTAVLLDHRGPESAGELVRIRCAITEPLPVIVGRLLGPDGKPFAGRRLETRITEETPADTTPVGLGRRRSRTSAAGRFRHALPASWNELSGHFSLEFQAEDAGGSALSARVALPARLAVGENDIGTITLARPPLIVEGQVVDPAGNPVAGAQIVLEVPRGERTRDTETVWRTVHEQRTSSNAKGGFELRGELEAELVGLRVAHPDHATSGRIEVYPGSRDVRIVLTPAGRIAGSLLFDEGFPHELFMIRAQSEEPSGPIYFAQVTADGGFLFAGVRDGSYRVAVSLRDEASCGEEFAGVKVQPAQTTQDERLQGIDLRKRLLSFTLEVVDAAGAPLAQGVVSRRVPGAAEFEQGRIWLRQGRADIATCLPALDLEIDVPGYRPLLLEAVSADRKVTMLQGPRLALSLRNAPELEPGSKLGVQIRLAEGGRWKPTASAWFEDGQAVEIEAKGPGKHEVYVMLMRRIAGGRRSQQVSAGPETTIEVAESAQLQFFEIELGAATLRTIEGL